MFATVWPVAPNRHSCIRSQLQQPGTYSERMCLRGHKNLEEAKNKNVIITRGVKIKIKKFKRLILYIRYNDNNKTLVDGDDAPHNTISAYQ